MCHHGGLLDDAVVGLLQVTVQDVAQQAGGALVQVPRPLAHPVVLAADGDVDALLLWGEREAQAGFRVTPCRRE